MGRARGWLDPVTNERLACSGHRHAFLARLAPGPSTGDAGAPVSSVSPAERPAQLRASSDAFTTCSVAMAAIRAHRNAQWIHPPGDGCIKHAVAVLIDAPDAYAIETGCEAVEGEPSAIVGLALRQEATTRIDGGDDADRGASESVARLFLVHDPAERAKGSRVWGDDEQAILIKEGAYQQRL